MPSAAAVRSDAHALLDRLEPVSRVRIQLKELVHFSLFPLYVGLNAWL
jgi:hypothetical protein